MYVIRDAQEHHRNVELHLYRKVCQLVRPSIRLLVNQTCFKIMLMILIIFIIFITYIFFIFSLFIMNIITIIFFIIIFIIPIHYPKKS